MPDNITSRNDRGSIVICEDGPVENYIRRLDRDGGLADIALNRLTSNADPAVTRYGEEFAGATFSPSGDTLFVNIQASRGNHLRDLGPVGSTRHLTAGGRRACLGRRAGAVRPRSDPDFAGRTTAA